MHLVEHCCRENISIPFDYLVLATGESHSYFGHDEFARHASALKTLADAVAVRNKILHALERAEAEEDVERRRGLLTFILVGADSTGVELAVALAVLRVAIILLAQTGGRTYSEGFSLRWSQVAFEGRLILLYQQCENSRIGGADPFARICLRCLACMEKGGSSDERICFPEPGSAKPPHLDGENCLENNTEASGRAGFSHLQPTPRLLYPSQRSSTGCRCRARHAAQRHAAHESGNQTALSVGNGRSGSQRRRPSEQKSCMENWGRYILVTVSSPQKRRTQKL